MAKDELGDIGFRRGFWRGVTAKDKSGDIWFFQFWAIVLALLFVVIPYIEWLFHHHLSKMEWLIVALAIGGAGRLIDTENRVQRIEAKLMRPDERWRLSG
jgi:putative copper export protein